MDRTDGTATRVETAGMSTEGQSRQKTIERLGAILERMSERLGGAGAVEISPRPNLCRPPREPTIAERESLAWWPTVHWPGAALSAPAGNGSWSLEAEDRAVVAISVLGLEGPALEQAIALVVEQQRRSRGFAPVFLFDATDHRCFRRHGYISEYFPRGVYGPEHAAAFHEKLLLVLRKWKPGVLVDLGPKGSLDERLRDIAIPELALHLDRVRSGGGAPFVVTPAAPKSAPARRPGPNDRALRHIQFLVARLRLGFETEALAELRTYVDGPVAQAVRSEAAWAMALWQLNKAGPASGAAAYEALLALDAAAPDRAEKSDYAVLLVEAFIRMGRIAEAKAACLQAWGRDQSADIALAMANVIASEPNEPGDAESAEKLRLTWMDRAFGNGTRATLSKRDVSSPLTLDNIRFEVTPLCGKLPLVSIIMPAYNASEHLATAIESALSQSWRSIELLVIDDASTDGTAEMVRQAAVRDTRIRLITNSRNMGTGYSRSLALAHARGMFVTGQDADDWAHPKKVEVQALHLLSDPNCIANLSEHVRATTDLVFSRRARPGQYLAPNYSSLMFRRDEIIRSVGFWDNVRFAEDAEYIARIERVFGRKAVPRLKTGPLLVARLHERQHTSATVSGYNGFNYGARAEYAEAYAYWHANAADEEALRLTFPLERRPFPVPLVMTAPDREAVHHFDVVVASDFRMQGGSTNSCVEEVKAQRNAGLRTGLMHIPRYDHIPTRLIASKIRELIDGDRVHLLTYGDRVVADLVIFRWPPALANRPAFLPEVGAGNLRIILNQAPQRRRDDETELYDLETVDERAAEIFGKRGVWAPIGPEARLALTNGAVDVSPTDWVNVLDLEEWSLRSVRPSNTKPVIGRHARDHADKWPETAERLLRAYPDSPDIAVSILGGAGVPRTILGALPKNWIVAEFDEIDPREYLRTLDVFVYYPHSQWIEAFGRVIFEAMAVGVPLVLPGTFRHTFGRAALYADIEDTQEAVKRLLTDDRLYRDQVRRARRFVEERFGHDAHIQRLSAFVRKLKRKPRQSGNGRARRRAGARGVHRDCDAEVRERHEVPTEAAKPAWESGR